MQINKTAILPQPDQIALEYSHKLQKIIAQEIEHAGAISFARFMELALYTPGLGYYSAGSIKFGAEGDFVTAPEISPLFSMCLAKQCSEIINQIDGDILEFGGGSGVMAANILLELERLNALPKHYFILEVSADLRARQKASLAKLIPHLIDKVTWLDNLPEAFSGVCIANEVLDAFPVHRFKLVQGVLKEMVVNYQNDNFMLELDQPSSALQEYWQKLNLDLLDNYESECNLNIAGWLASLGKFIEKGVVILIDYGFPRKEYYHADRFMGTFMCHYRHHAHDNPFVFVGLQDMTAHVDFTGVATAGIDSGFTVSGYTNQASFLLSCGMIDYLERMSHQQQYQYYAQQFKVLTSPTEMGELFKVIALVKNFDSPLLGFAMRDYSERL